MNSAYLNCHSRKTPQSLIWHVRPPIFIAPELTLLILGSHDLSPAHILATSQKRDAPKLYASFSGDNQLMGRVFIE